MSVSDQRVLMGLGARVLELDWDPDIAAKLVKGALIQMYKGETLNDTWVITQREVREEGISIAGVAPDWLLGLESEGPLITDTEYLAGNNKVFNPGFELGDLYWRLGQDTLWRIATTSTYVGGAPRSGSWFASLALDPIDEADQPLDDDVLEVDREYDALPGEEYLFGAWVRRISGSVGRLRLRALLGGRFVHPNVLPSTLAGWTDTSEFTADCDIDGVTGVATIGPTTRKQLVPNPGFETGDFTDWDGDFTDLTVTTGGLNYEGNNAAQYDGFVGGGGGDIWTDAFAVKPKERYKLDAFSIVWGTPDPLQSVGGTLLSIAPQDFATFHSVDVDTPYVFTSDGHLDQGDLLNVWKHFEQEFEIADDVSTIWLLVHFYGIEDPALIQVWDALTITRIKGNRCSLESPSFAVVPKRSYEGTLFAEMPATLVSGTLSVVARFSAAGRPDVLADLASLNASPGETKVVSYTVQAPSGYDNCVLIVAGEDVEGDSFTVRMGPLVDNDSSTRAVDGRSPETAASYFDLGFDLTIPAGAEKFRLQIIAESESAGWEVDDTSITRLGATSTVAEIATALLRDYETDNPLLLPGDIHGADVITYDWHIINQHNRDALRHLLEGGVASSLREYRVNPDLTVDVGTASELFGDDKNDRTDLVFTEADIDVLVAPSVVEDVTNRATHIKVIGATRQRANGDSFTITATAAVAWDDEPVDAFGAPLHRVRVVENSTINHPDYAEAYATFLAAQEAAQPKATTLRLSSDRARGAGIKPGQWLYVYSPDAGLEDVDNEQRSEDGVTVFPERLRVLSVSERYGEGDCRAYLRRPDGTTMLLEGVRWEDQNEVEVQLGAYVPDFIVNDQGGAAFRQFLRYRASALR